ncbi:ABC transporter ATP-binding protein [Desulfobacterota bacterium M19]
MLIECKRITKTYRSDNKLLKAVDGASFTADKGDFVVILGHSGSGKTTLLSLVGGLTRPDEGEVLIHNISNWQQSDQALSVMRNKTIGFIFQFASLIPSLNVLENMALPLCFGHHQHDSTALAYKLLEEIGLADKAKAFPGQLSGGQQRRVSIARAFMNKPEIILADEPTGDLDEDTENDILAMFRRYNDQGCTFLVVTHNNELGASQNNPRTLRMRQGVLHV